MCISFGSISDAYAALCFNLLLFRILGKVPCIKNNDKQKIVAISKHLCGAATGEVPFGDLPGNCF